jgi:hypothetical protein
LPNKDEQQFFDPWGVQVSRIEKRPAISRRAFCFDGGGGGTLELIPATSF